MKVLALTPRGYCHGVVNAIATLRKIARDERIPRPVHVLGMVVHNSIIVDDFEKLGIITLNDKQKTRLELLDEIDSGTVVFTAHGVSDKVFAKAQAKNLNIIDTTCIDVKKSQETLKDYLKDGYDVLFIGRHNHPESETARSYDADKVAIIETETDIKNTNLQSKKIAITNQTTMSLFDIYQLTEKIKEKYPNVTLIEEQCDATRIRQMAVMQQPKTVEHCFVVGDIRSNNTKKLVEVSEKEGVKASRIESIKDLDIEHLKTLNYISVTSGASTPSHITKEVITYLKQFDKNNPQTHPIKSAY